MENSKRTEDELKIWLMNRLVCELPVLRARLGVSQADIARKIGISRQTYNSIETGKRKMNWTIFVALIAVFRNNEQTRKMIKMIDSFEDNMNRVIEF